MSINQKLEPRASIEDEPESEVAQVSTKFYVSPKAAAQAKTNGSGGYAFILLAVLIVGYLGYSYFVPGNYSALMTNQDVTHASPVPAAPPVTTTAP